MKNMILSGGPAAFRRSLKPSNAARFDDGVRQMAQNNQIATYVPTATGSRGGNECSTCADPNASRAAEPILAYPSTCAGQAPNYGANLPFQNVDPTFGAPLVRQRELWAHDLTTFSSTLYAGAYDTDKWVAEIHPEDGSAFDDTTVSFVGLQIGSISNEIGIGNLTISFKYGTVTGTESLTTAGVYDFMPPGNSLVSQVYIVVALVETESGNTQRVRGVQADMLYHETDAKGVQVEVENLADNANYYVNAFLANPGLGVMNAYGRHIGAQ